MSIRDPWCVNIEGRYLKFKASSGNDWGLGCADEFKFCPICGTPRPEPKQSLADVLRDAYQTNSGENKYSIRKCYEAEEKAAREYIYQENMEKLEEIGSRKGAFLFTIDELREVLK